jgi:hypothetical protein
MFMARIGKPRAVIGQSLLMANGANPPKGKFLDAVTRLKIGDAELSYPLDQSGQARCYLRFSLLFINKRGGGGVQLHVRPLMLDMHLNQ